MRDHPPMEIITLTRAITGAWSMDTGNVGAHNLGPTEMLDALAAHIMPAPKQMTVEEVVHRAMNDDPLATIEDLPEGTLLMDLLIAMAAEADDDDKSDDDKSDDDESDDAYDAEPMGPYVARYLRERAMEMALSAGRSNHTDDLIESARKIAEFLKGGAA